MENKANRVKTRKKRKRERKRDRQKKERITCYTFQDIIQQQWKEKKI